MHDPSQPILLLRGSEVQAGHRFQRFLRVTRDLGQAVVDISHLSPFDNGQPITNVFGHGPETLHAIVQRRVRLLAFRDILRHLNAADDSAILIPDGIASHLPVATIGRLFLRLLWLPRLHRLRDRAIRATVVAPGPNLVTITPLQGLTVFPHRLISGLVRPNDPMIKVLIDNVLGQTVEDAFPFQVGHVLQR